MKVIFNYSKRDSSKNLEDLVEKKLNKIKKYFKGEVIAEVNIKAEGKSHAMSIAVDTHGNNFNVNSVNKDMYKNVDLCIDKLKTQVKKAKMEYRTDSKKVNDKVAFSDMHNLEQEIDLEREEAQQ
jgi:putative sigma-54 modulation protein